MALQYSGGNPNHSQSPPPMFKLTEQKLLFSWWAGGAAAGHLEVQLCTVDPLRWMADVVQHVPLGELNAEKGRQFLQLCQLCCPPIPAVHVDVGGKTHRSVALYVNGTPKNKKNAQ